MLDGNPDCYFLTGFTEFFTKLGAWMTKDVKEFTISIIPNTTRVTIYYTPKPILKMLKNPKCLKCIIQDGHIEVKGSSMLTTLRS